MVCFGNQKGQIKMRYYLKIATPNSWECTVKCDSPIVLALA